MKTKKIFLIAAFYTGLASAQATTSEECTEIKNQYIITGDGYYFPKGYETFYNPPTSALSSSRQQYLSRLVLALKARGTEAVFIILPNFPDGSYSTDPRLRNVNPERRLSSYETTVIKSFRDAGANIVNLLPPMMNSAKQNPTDWLRQRKDYHWSPTGMRVSAQATAAYLQGSFPDLLKNLPESLGKVKLGPSVPRIGDIERRIQTKCPDFKLEGELLPPVELINGGSQDLLGDVPADVVLLGTSYSARPPGFGFDYFLEESLRTPIVNAAINGGGPMGAFLDYFSQTDVKYPKLLLWEFASSAFDNNWSPFNELYFRQAIPLVSKSVLVEKTEKKSSSGRFDLVFNNKNQNPSFLALDLGTGKSRVVKVKLTYEHGSEAVELNHTHGNNLSEFSIDLDEDKGRLMRAEVEVPANSNTTVLKVSIRSYVSAK